MVNHGSDRLRVVRSYAEYCPIAKALDVIGDRWSLLILRELLSQGACRYTDLKNGLPGIATNLLSGRITELEAAGLIRREEAPPPVATTLFHPTDAGRDLAPVIGAIGQWGLRYMAEPSADDAFRGHWLAFPAIFFLEDRDPAGPPVAIELRSAGETAVIDVAGDAITTRLGGAASPDLVLDGVPPLVFAVLMRRFTADEAVALGLTVTGDVGVLDRVRPKWA